MNPNHRAGKILLITGSALLLCGILLAFTYAATLTPWFVTISIIVNSIGVMLLRSKEQ